MVGQAPDGPIDSAASSLKMLHPTNRNPQLTHYPQLRESARLTIEMVAARLAADSLTAET